MALPEEGEKLNRSGSDLRNGMLTLSLPLRSGPEGHFTGGQPMPAQPRVVVILLYSCFLIADSCLILLCRIPP